MTQVIAPSMIMIPVVKSDTDADVAGEHRRWRLTSPASNTTKTVHLGESVREDPCESRRAYRDDPECCQALSHFIASVPARNEERTAFVHRSVQFPGCFWEIPSSGDSLTREEPSFKDTQQDSAGQQLAPVFGEPHTNRDRPEAQAEESEPDLGAQFGKHQVLTMERTTVSRNSLSRGRTRSDDEELTLGSSNTLVETVVSHHSCILFLMHRARIDLHVRREEDHDQVRIAIAHVQCQIFPHARNQGKGHVSSVHEGNGIHAAQDR